MDFDLIGKKRILVIGDVILDQYLWGEVSRISPEAPVPVVHVREKSEVLGGAGNVAANLAGMGCQTVIIGICGVHEAGDRLKNLLRSKGIKYFLVSDDRRPTITKTRIMGHNQQLLRLDVEEPLILGSAIKKEFLRIIEKNITDCHAVIISDYGKGIFQTPGICQVVIGLGRKYRVPVLVDPKGREWERYHGATCITPNVNELNLVSESSIKEDENSLIAVSKTIRERYGLQWLLATRGPKGMILTGRDKHYSFPAKALEVFDVSGAGDTVVAALAAGVASGLSFPKAAEMANTAAGVVVGKLGTHPVTVSEIRAALLTDSFDNKVFSHSSAVSAETARMQVQAWRASGARIVFAYGCFDMPHPGHIHLLNRAKALGDRLVVGLNTDDSVRRIKGEGKPIMQERDRVAMLGAMKCVDLIALSDADTPVSLIQALNPDVVATGSLENKIGSDIESYGARVCRIPRLEGPWNTVFHNPASVWRK